MTTEQFIDNTIRREGGFSNRAADRGGPTKYGITAMTLGKRRGLNRPATAAEVQALTVEEARAIYGEEYIPPFAVVPDPLRAMLIDWGVTSGQRRSARFLQRHYASRGLYTGAIDGLLGPKSAEAVLADDNHPLTYRALFVARDTFYHRLALQDPEVRAFLNNHPATQLHNLNGWNNRCLEFVLPTEDR